MILTLYKCFQHWSEKGSVYLYSDPHFGDLDMTFLRSNNISDTEQIERINMVVSKNDTLIILGDVGNDYERLGELHGYKILILGNHDKGKSIYRPYVHEIYEGPLFISEKLILSHEPINFEFAFNIHGHDHSNVTPHSNNRLNVCCEHINYTPLNLGKLIKNGLLKDVTSIHRIAIDKQILN